MKIFYDMTQIDAENSIFVNLGFICELFMGFLLVIVNTIHCLLFCHNCDAMGQLLSFLPMINSRLKIL